MKNLLLLLTLAFALCSCHSENIQPAEKGGILNEEDPLQGYWIAGDYLEETTIYNRAGKFDPDKGGFAFFENGKLIERSNSGWCGTPPISYAEYEGNWTVNEENLLVLNSTYWGGEHIVTYEIISVDENKLVLKYIFK